MIHFSLFIVISPSYINITLLLQTFLFVHPDHGPEGLQIKSVAGGEVGGTAGGEEDGWHSVELPVTTEPI